MHINRHHKPLSHSNSTSAPSHTHIISTASLLPPAAVTPAPIAYIEVLAVQKARSWISAEDSRSGLAGEDLNGPGHLFRRVYLQFIV